MQRAGHQQAVEQQQEMTSSTVEQTPIEHLVDIGAAPSSVTSAMDNGRTRQVADSDGDEDAVTREQNHILDTSANDSSASASANDSLMLPIPALRSSSAIDESGDTVRVHSQTRSPTEQDRLDSRRTNNYPHLTISTSMTLTNMDTTASASANPIPHSTPVHLHLQQRYRYIGSVTGRPVGRPSA